MCSLSDKICHKMFRIKSKLPMIPDLNRQNKYGSRAPVLCVCNNFDNNTAMKMMMIWMVMFA